MRSIIIQNIDARFQSWADLAATIDADLLEQSLPVTKSKSLKEHFWCVIGGRESYVKALRENGWSGFSCSLTEFTPEGISQKLADSSAEFASVIQDIAPWTDDRDGQLVSLLEHETMHEGQVIRLMYGLDRQLPPSWKWA
jgi:hypothetical protein